MATPYSLTAPRAAHAVELPAPGEAPSWVHLIPVGEFRGRDGRGPWRLDDPAAVIAATANSGVDLVVDYDHASEFRKSGAPAPAAGWVRQLEARTDGLWGLVEWTRRAASAVGEKEWRYISPVFAHDKGGRVLALISAALTNTPNLTLTALHSQETPMAITPRLAKILGLPDTADDDAVATAAQGLADLAAGLRKALGVPDDAKPEAIATAAQAATDSAKAARGALSLGPEANGAEIIKAIQSRGAGDPDPAKWAPVEQLRAVNARVTELETTAKKASATASVEAAIEDGRLPPAQREWAAAYCERDPDGFRTFVSGAPVIVAPGTTKTAGKPPAADAPLTAEEKAVCSAMGVSTDAFIAERKARRQAEEARA